MTVGHQPYSFALDEAPAIMMRPYGRSMATTASVEDKDGGLGSSPAKQGVKSAERNDLVVCSRTVHLRSARAAKEGTRDHRNYVSMKVNRVGLRAHKTTWWQLFELETHLSTPSASEASPRQA